MDTMKLYDKCLTMANKYGQSIYQKPEDLPQKFSNYLIDHAWNEFSAENAIIEGVCKYHLINNTKYKDIAEKSEYYNDKREYFSDPLYNKLRYYYNLLGYFKYRNEIELMTTDEPYITLNDEYFECGWTLVGCMIECAKKYNMIPYNDKHQQISYDDISEIVYFRMPKIKFDIQYSFDYLATGNTTIEAYSYEEAIEKFKKGDFEEDKIDLCEKTNYQIEQIEY